MPISKCEYYAIWRKRRATKVNAFTKQQQHQKSQWFEENVEKFSAHLFEYHIEFTNIFNCLHNIIIVKPIEKHYCLHDTFSLMFQSIFYVSGFIEKNFLLSFLLTTHSFSLMNSKFQISFMPYWIWYRFKFHFQNVSFLLFGNKCYNTYF